MIYSSTCIDLEFLGILYEGLFLHCILAFFFFFFFWGGGGGGFLGTYKHSVFKLRIHRNFKSKFKVKNHTTIIPRNFLKSFSRVRACWQKKKYFHLIIFHFKELKRLWPNHTAQRTRSCSQLVFRMLLTLVLLHCSLVLAKGKKWLHDGTVLHCMISQCGSIVSWKYRLIW